MKLPPLLTATVASAFLLAAPAAHAAPVLGSNVDSSVFSAAIGSTAGWTYLGQNTSAFSGPGTGELELRVSTFDNSFGYARTNHTGRVQVFGPGASPGATAAIAGYAPEYLFYFKADAHGFFGGLYDNVQYTDGYDTGGLIGEEGGDIDIFFNASSNTWAFFYDDSGPISLHPDDDDYNDLVVTFRQQVPAPGALSLVGLGAIGLMASRRRRA
jgi:hypothetical protein